jgi:hypothetical protein
MVVVEPGFDKLFLRNLISSAVAPCRRSVYTRFAQSLEMSVSDSKSMSDAGRLRFSLPPRGAAGHSPADLTISCQIALSLSARVVARLRRRFYQATDRDGVVDRSR